MQRENKELFHIQKSTLPIFFVPTIPNWLLLLLHKELLFSSVKVYRFDPFSLFA